MSHASTCCAATNGVGVGRTATAEHKQMMIDSRLPATMSPMPCFSESCAHGKGSVRLAFTARARSPVSSHVPDHPYRGHPLSHRLRRHRHRCRLHRYPHPSAAEQSFRAGRSRHPGRSGRYPAQSFRPDCHCMCIKRAHGRRRIGLEIRGGELGRKYTRLAGGPHAQE
jgi:hypothetical protein